MCCKPTSKMDIIRQLASNEQLLYELKNIHQAEYTDDVIQDIWLRFIECEDEDKLIKLCEQNQMKFYLIRILINQTRSNNSKTNRTYKIKTEINPLTLINMTEETNNIDNELVQDIITSELNKLTFYDRRIFELVANSSKTFKELEQEIKIKNYNIFYTFNKVRLQLRKALKKYDLNE